MARQRHHKQGGAALLLVIWVVALLSLLAAIALQITTTTAHIAEAGLVRARLQAASEGAISLALLEMIDPDSNARWPVDGTARTLEVGGQQVTVSAIDEAGKVDVNQAPDDLLKAVFISTGAATDDARKWVDSLNKKRGVSASGSQTATSDSNEGGRQIQTVEAVAGVAGISPQAFCCIRPTLTVYTGLHDVDRRYASEAVRRALAKPVADVGYTELSNQAPDIAAGESFAGRVFSIEATASAGQAAFSRHVVLRITGDSGRPYLVAWWGEDFSEPSATACQQ